ncbi:right-handed parallel beta-helix repeat-containing protein [Streptomyces sp. NPDC046805]|uniref:right-handed parallel beta-helix repeat-containing protein n=1 Tax=Streptomyces sp. NPDC046805 TaxID=3155134 RepID=UPI0033D2851C
MKKCHIAYLACTAAVLGAGLGAAPPVAAHSTHLVRPGESIQKAVNAARPGDTVLVAPGIYYGSVKVTTRGLTLRGSGPYTVIKPGPKKAGDSCSEGGYGICVIGKKTRDITGVTVTDMTVTGFARAGVFGMGTDGMTVRHVNAVDNKVWGIAQERSVRGVFRNNYAHGNGDAGLFLANTVKEEAGAQDTKGTLIAGNRLEGNRIGVTVRRLRNLTVRDNYLARNCAGVFVVGDENKPKAGALTVRDNRLDRNNKYCPKTDRLPAIQGSGIVLTGTEDTLVTRNLVTNNAGKSPMSGGIVLFKSMVHTTSERNRISGNVLQSNGPADLVNTETAKSRNTFTRNTCRTSRPAGMC